MAAPGWGRVFASADGLSVYEDLMVPRLFEPWAELLLDRVGVAAGDRVLDVATGPGTVARLAAARAGSSGTVVGCDLSAGMLERAAAKPPVPGGAPIDYRECPADALAVDDAAFDVVTCQQGLQFFPDRASALAEMRRAARPGGRVGIAVWASIDDCPPFAALASGVEEVLGPDPAARYRGGPWGFSDREALTALVGGAGFAEVAVERHQLPVVFEGGPEQLAGVILTSPAGNAAAALDDDGRRRLVEVTARALGQPGDGAVRSHMTAHVAVARR